MRSSIEKSFETDSDDEFNEDMEALKRACQITGINPTDRHFQPPSTADFNDSSTEADSDGEGVDDDLALVRSIQQRFAVSTDMEVEPLTLKPLCTMMPDWSDTDDCADDFETLRAIQRRFNAYDGGLKDNSDDILHRHVQVGATVIDSGKETSNSLFVERTNASEEFHNCVDKDEHTENKAQAFDDAVGTEPCDLVGWNELGTDFVAGLPLESSHFPKSAHAFVDAIKKNRSCQKLIRSKMMQMEGRIEELKKLIERVKVLKDFQVSCKKRTGRALSLKRDARVQLISVPKQRGNTKVNENAPALCKGPSENLHVANYREALATSPFSVRRVEWSQVEKEHLLKGLRQQFQGMLLQRSVDLLCDADGFSSNPNNIDSIIGSIKDLDITPEKIRLFLPKVNWEQLAAMYVPGRCGAECQARFLNCEDLLINQNPWTKMEDKNLLHIVQQKGLSNWIDIAALLGTNRTPFQCLARYQRSLNASVIRREWMSEEDSQLRAAVETYGENNWQLVSSMVEGRTGTQCSNRWLKTLHPARKKVGKWSTDEDKRLRVAATLFGGKKWRKIAAFVPGRTFVQCRERWVNILDPSLNTSRWSEEEDSILKAAVAEHGYCWSKVAGRVPHRTDNQCWRRWKALFPHEVPLLQVARKIQKAALISNFVDRKSERPALEPNDFIPPPELQRITESINADPSKKGKRRSRRKKTKKCIESESPPRNSEICSEDVRRLTNGSEIENKDRGSIQMEESDQKRPRLRNRKMGIKQCSKESSESDRTEEFTSTSVDPDYANPYKKTFKLNQRRRRAETSVEDPTILKMKETEKGKKTKKKRAYTTNDHLSHLPDSTLLKDVMKEFDTVHGNNSRRKKMKTQEASCSSNINEDFHDLGFLSEKDNDLILLQYENASSPLNFSEPVPYYTCDMETPPKTSNEISEETEEEDITLASFLKQQSVVRRTPFSGGNVGKLKIEEHK